MNCVQCKAEFQKEGESRMVASISGSIQGDECIESYFFCKNCGVYTVEVYWDMFSGDEKASVYGPVSKEEGDVKVELIRQCSRPWDKKCRCAAHRDYFGDSLD